MATPSLCSRLSEVTLEKLEQLDEEELRLLADAVEAERYAAIDERCSRKIASEKAGPLYWLQNHTKTVDDHALEKGTPPEMPFPKKSYFLPLMDCLLKERRILIPKSREMISSWTICGYVTWLAQWYGPLTGVIQTVKEEKAKELIRYCTILAMSQDPQLLEKHPLAGRTDLRLEWASGSRIFGIPGGEDQIRMYHPHVVVFDEVAAMVDAEQCWNAAEPVSSQMIGVSTARPGWFAEECESGPEQDETSVQRIVKAKLAKPEQTEAYLTDRQHCYFNGA
jgi:hypothetical protein